MTQEEAIDKYVSYAHELKALQDKIWVLHKKMNKMLYDYPGLGVRMQEAAYEGLRPRDEVMIEIGW